MSPKLNQPQFVGPNDPLPWSHVRRLVEVRLGWKLSDRRVQQIGKAAEMKIKRELERMGVTI